MVTAENPQEPHSVHSARLLDHAGAALADGDRLQASEKIWGAVSHALREVASKRRWPISVNADARDVARYIAQETGDSELAALGGAELYHYNFYKDAMDVEDIKDGLATAERICGKLLAANDALPSSLPPPRGPKFRAYERRNGLAPDPPYTSEEWAAFVRTRDRLAAQALDLAAPPHDGQTLVAARGGRRDSRLRGNDGAAPRLQYPLPPRRGVPLPF